MDKFRRNRKTSTPTRAHPATSSNEATTTSKAAAAPTTSSSTSTATKFTIQQKVPSGTAPKKGPYSVKRTVDPNEVFIKRRIGEGSKPLFSRNEFRSKRSTSPKSKRTSSSSSSSSRSSSPENRCRTTTKEPSKAVQPTKRKSPEKVPYFLDEKREVDRIKKLYGRRRSRSLSPVDRRRSSTFKSSRNRSRSSTPVPTTIRGRVQFYANRNRRRSPSRERYRSRHRHRSEYSRSRSRSRERRRAKRYRDELSNERSLLPAPHFIPVPVPMPPAWGPPIMPPQPRFPYMIRPPIPAPVPFMPRHFHPPRFFMPNGFQRGNFRPRY
ncbi:female-specific protein transformer isoform X2 [Eupeodes corollae]|uniref:female-specific protein transformer isoform X2 n=1 Tax=Eupeodes corollae TaxID=290404 RepID=UPI002490F8E1|nr:female-specific protein transformer isoform X2 [Eupeodes corollae]